MDVGDLIGPLLGFIGLLISLVVNARGKKREDRVDAEALEVRKFQAHDGASHKLIDQLQEEVARLTAERRAAEAHAEELTIRMRAMVEAHEDAAAVLRVRLAVAEAEAERLRLQGFG